jgi:hypothetical protein
MRIISKGAFVAIAACVGACGGGGGSNGITRIKGTWRPTSYSSIVDCGTVTSTDNVGGDVVWNLGTDTDLIQTAANTGCTIKADVMGSTARLFAPQVCVVFDDAQDEFDITTSAYTFTLGANSQTAIESGSGSAVVTFPDTGGVVSCPYTLQATYTKLAP